MEENRYETALSVILQKPELTKFNLILWLLIRKREEETGLPILCDETELFNLVKEYTHTAKRLVYIVEDFEAKRGWGEIVTIGGKRYFASNELLANHPEILSRQKPSHITKETQQKTMIYAFRIGKSPIAKVGMTKRNFKDRLRNIVRKSEVPDEAIELVLWEEAGKNGCKPITDIDVHKELQNMGIFPVKGKSREWFRADDKQIRNAFDTALLKKQLAE